MKRFVVLLASVLVAAAAAEPSGLGLGVIAGEPTGLSAKAWLSGNTAVDAAAAWSAWEHGYHSLHLHADFLAHSFGLFDLSSGELPLYYGVGGRVRLAGHEENQKMRVGVRVPVGISYLFESVPIDLFLEVVPLLDLIPSTDFGWNSGIGARYYFQ